MLIVKVARWHVVERLRSVAGPAVRCCSVCGGVEFGAPAETALDAATGRYYDVVRCPGCNYDLLEPVPPAAAVIA
jgi:hypothetical protein